MAHGTVNPQGLANIVHKRSPIIPVCAPITISCKQNVQLVFIFIQLGGSISACFTHTLRPSRLIEKIRALRWPLPCIRVHHGVCGLVKNCVQFRFLVFHKNSSYQINMHSRAKSLPLRNPSLFPWKSRSF